MALAVKEKDVATLDPRALADRIWDVLGPERTAQLLRVKSIWPETYVNRDTGAEYEPHHEAERSVVFSDVPKNVLIKGGEGGGKTVAGVIKTCERLRRGMSGAMLSPDFEHFRVSTWEEFIRWLPRDVVIPRHQYYFEPGWTPSKRFNLVVRNDVGGYSTLWCGGAKEDQLGTWEGPNYSFVFADELRRHKKPGVIKTLAGRLRRAGPNGEPPQFYLTTTPRKHWMFEYFGPLMIKCPEHGDQRANTTEGDPKACPECQETDVEVRDPQAAFKAISRVITLKTSDNVAHLSEGFIAERAAPLSSKEQRVLLDAEWEDENTQDRFLGSMLWWDDCYDPDLPPLGPKEKVVVALDAATGRVSGLSDCFGIVGVTRHPDQVNFKDSYAIRFALAWQAKEGEKIDFRGTVRNPGPERVLLKMKGYAIDDKGAIVRSGRPLYNIKVVCFDNQQLHDMAQRFRRRRVVWMYEFSQGPKRIEADTDFLNAVTQTTVAHGGEKLLREHVDNADRKLNDDGKKLRIVKRHDALKIDLAVCASMALYRAAEMKI